MYTSCYSAVGCFPPQLLIEVVCHLDICWPVAILKRYIDRFGCVRIKIKCFMLITTANNNNKQLLLSLYEEINMLMEFTKEQVYSNLGRINFNGFFMPVVPHLVRIVRHICFKFTCLNLFTRMCSGLSDFCQICFVFCYFMKSVHFDNLR